MSKATAKARNPDAPPGYVRPQRSKYDLTVELMEQAYLGDMYLHYFAIMKDSPFFTDPDMVILSDFELNSSDEEKEAEIESIPPENDTEEISILKESNKEETGDKSETAIKIIKSELDESKGRNETKEKSRKGSKMDNDKSETLTRKIKEERDEFKVKKEKEESKKSSKRDEGEDEAPKRNIKGEHSKGKKESKKKKSSKKDKATLVPDYGSSDSDCDKNYSEDGHRRRQRKQYSRSPSPVRIKEEDGTDFIHGHYNCEVCHITMNSRTTYETHVNGKRHQKNLKVKNMSLGIPSSSNLIDPDVEVSKYPKVPEGVIRTTLREKALIQNIVERKIVICPGLSKVTEIRGVKEIQYYCGICDALCSDSSIIPHLSGYKHRMNTLEHYRPDLYDQYKDKPKYKSDKVVPGLLKSIQRREGLGRVVVEREVMSCNNSGSNSNYAVSMRDMPSTSSQRFDDIPFDEHYSQSCQPDTSKSDFYCKTCESHMNSIAMWESHIRGKRHLTNLKKAPGAMPSKTRTVRVPDGIANLIERLEYENEEKEPIVGLDHIQETQIPETRSETYNCFLCGACLTALDIIDHLVSMKHRRKYLEHIEYPELSVLDSIRHQDAAYSLAREMCMRIEATVGRGTPSVHVAKNIGILNL